MRRFVSIAFVLVVLALARIAAAQGLQKVATPIEVHVAPASGGTSGAKTLVVPPSTTVKIYGTSVALAKTGSQVKVEVKPPAGAPATQTASIGADGSWSTTFSSTKAEGQYAVTAFSADGKNSATTAFVVGTAAAIAHVIDDMIATDKKVAADAGAGISMSQQSLAEKGPFPDQDKVTKNLNDVAAALKEFPARLDAAKAGLSKLGEIAKQYPGGASELEPITSAIQEATQKSQQADEQIIQATAATGKTLGVCDRIDAVNEVLSAASLFFDVKGKLYEKVIQLATDKYLPDKIYNAAVPPAKRDNTEKFGLAENLKAFAGALTGQVTGGMKQAPGSIMTGGAKAADQSLLEFVTKPKNLLLDTAQMLTGLAFDKLCEKFTGPVTGTFSVDATVSGMKFWGYSATLDGTLTLMYEKSLGGKSPIPMTGEIEGNAAFKMYEDLVAFNNFNRAFVIAHFLIPPVGMSSSASSAVNPLGKAARMATPGYFRVPVKGALSGTQLTLTVGDAAYNDFGEAIKGRVMYAFNPPGSPVPYVMTSIIPVQKAQFILSRGLRTTGVLPVATATKGKTITKTAEKTFDRKEVVSDGEVTVLWKLNVKACNPDCP